MMGNELKLCPFCGGEAAIFASEDGGVCVVCTDCLVRTQSYVDSLQSCKTRHAVDKVVSEWNRRVYNG